MAIKAELKDIGDRATPQWTWTVGGSPTDPSQIVVKQQDADGVETTVTTASSPGTLTTASQPLARMSPGVFKLSPGSALTKAGYWLIRAEGTGAAEAAAPDFLYKVSPSEFYTDAGVSTRALVSLQETKDWLNSQDIQTGDELDLVRVINDVSERLHYESGREFKVNGTNPQTRNFFADDAAIQWGCVHVGDLTALSTATTTPVRIIADDWATTVQSLTTASLVLEPESRAAWEPIRRIRFNSRTVNFPFWGYRIQVDGNYGFPSVPGNVRQATLDAIASVYDRDVQHWRLDQAPAESGANTNVLVFPGRPQLLSLPPSAVAVVREFQDSLVG
jgi:hypothetical protein